MLWGRCNLLSTTRYLSELSRKQYSRNRRKSNALTESASLAFVPAQLRYRSTDNARDLVSLSKRMSSSSSSSSQGHQMGQKEAKVMTKNRLASEKSPYLLQHASNPVQWYPWGDEALERARAEDKLIFLSVGYSTCHWCHVMERESFENPEIADIMNKNFINIKVDREERPDIDRIYMTFIQSITGHGGWPMSVFLAPDLTPITGGTYFPPENKHGYPGFKTILLGISREWQENKNEIMQHGRAIIEKLRNVAEKQEKKEQSVPTEECATTCVRLLSRSYEPQFGGFSGAPKFPQPVNFNLLFHVYARDPNSEMGQKSLDMCVYTLRKMAAGGIHDHVGQGFVRYSVDDEWHVPHFEKMLYDQGQLMQSYADAFLATKDPFFAEIVDDIATYVTRDLRHKEGGFYSAEDADSFPTEKSREKKEGAFYVWSYNEIQELLSRELPDAKNTKLADIFSFHFSVKVNGNVPPHRDPHGELTKKNVLIEYGSLEETAEHFGLTVERTKSLLKEAKEILFEARKKRPRPHLDDKIVTAWNGLMISGLSKAGAATGNERYTELATNAARFVERYLYDETQHLLLRSCYRDEDDTITQLSVPIRGYHTDYAFLVKGLLDLYEAGLDPHWLQLAETLQDVQDQLFWDSTNGAYFSTTKDDPTVILRLKDDHDGAEPCGNSIACSNLLRLGSFLNRESFKDKAEKLLAYFAGTLTRMPAALPEMVSSLLHYRDSSTQIYVVGKTDAEDTKELLRVVNERLVPGKVLIFADHERSNNALLRKNKVLARMKQQNGRATAYVCRYHTCSLPVTSPSDLANLLSNDR